MPATFAFPDGNAVDLYSPLVFTADELNGRRSHSLTVIGRLKPDVTVDTATADVRAIAQRIFPTDRASNPDVTIAGAHDVLVENARLGLIVLFGAVGFVLLIACANVASLLLVRGSVRRREVAMRAALGAGRGRLVRQLLTESVLLAIIGAAAGVVIARSLLLVLARIHPPNLPRVDQIGIDGTVLLFVTGAAVLTGVAFGIIPALQAATPRLSDATKVVTPTYTAASRGRFGLVAGEVALALMLAAGAGLMIRSLIQLQALDLGFAPAGVVSAQVLLPAARYPPDPAQFRPAQSCDACGRYQAVHLLQPTGSPVASDSGDRIGRRGVGVAAQSRRYGLRPAGNRRRKTAPAPRGGTASRLSGGDGQLLSHDAHAVDRRTRIHGIRRPRHDAGGHHQRHAGPTDICRRKPDRQAPHSVRPAA